jgi:hypothetical protein
MKFRCCVALVFAGLAPLGTTSAGVIYDDPTFDGMLNRSTLVVVARVSEVVDSNGDRIATARVRDVWKGISSKKVRYRAAGMGEDISGATKGENVVLFLKTLPGLDIMVISDRGYGRYGIFGSDEGPLVLLTFEPRPGTLSLVTVKMPGGQEAQAVPLRALRDYVVSKQRQH